MKELERPDTTSIWQYAVFTAFALTVLVVTSSVWNIGNLEKQAIHIATEEARSNWNKDQAFRRWATRHGGLYVKPDDRTPPNPYLDHVPNRDVETTDGVKLTLMNPAYMMSQMTKEFESMYGIKGKITGQVLLNPLNEADPWELEGLKKFDQGVTEVSEQADIDGRPYIRLIRPMVMTEGCVLCHGHLGFKVGDIRGGVSISIPLTPYFQAVEKSKISLLFTHVVVWSIGMLTIGFMFWRGHRRAGERAVADKALNESLVQLKKANEEAQSANKAKSEFLSTVSHELRTPLTSIKGALGLLSGGAVGALPDQASDMLNLANKNTDRLVSLVNDILDVEKLLAGKMEFHFEQLDLRALVIEAVAENEGVAIEHEVTFVLPGEISAVMVQGDRHRLFQVMANLLSNAAKFSPKGSTVEIALTHDDVLAKVSVSDHGAGMPKGFEKHAFDQFSQADATDSRQTAGSGLGLHISKAIINEHGGDIGLETEEGVGTTVFFTLNVLNDGV